MKPPVATTVALLRRGDELLLAMKKRGFGAGRWNGAGGKLDPGETPEQAMVRECQEEIGITPTRYELMAFHDFILEASSPDEWHQHSYVYVVTEWQGEPVETEEMAPRWFKADALPYDQMWSDDIHWLPRVLAGQKLRTVFGFDHDEQMISHDITGVDTL